VSATIMTRGECEALDVLERIARGDGPGADEAWEALTGYRSGRLSFVEALGEALAGVADVALNREHFNRQLDEAIADAEDAANALRNAKRSFDRITMNGAPR
jgi:hypothetical protein